MSQPLGGEWDGRGLFPRLIERLSPYPQIHIWPKQKTMTVFNSFYKVNTKAMVKTLIHKAIKAIIDVTIHSITSKPVGITINYTKKTSCLRMKWRQSFELLKILVHNNSKLSIKFTCLNFQTWYFYQKQKLESSPCYTITEKNRWKLSYCCFQWGVVNEL